jgi:DmsE family decaheme c-type cytochrome
MSGVHPRAAVLAVSIVVMVLTSAAGAAAAQQSEAQAALAKDAVCTSCHNETWRTPVLDIYQTPHGNRADPRAPGCQSCHGTSTAHQGNFRIPPDIVFGAKSKHLSDADTRSRQCLTCHDTSVLPRANWEGSQHQASGVACTSCHDIHDVKDPKVQNKATQALVCATCHKAQQAQIQRISAHPLAVKGFGAAPKMACSDCHNPHGSTGPRLLVKNTVNETCYTCHAEKRGPFLWEHVPVTDDCTTCHTPHGSTTAPLLKARAPILCQECHSGDHGAQVNSGSNLAGGNVTTVNGSLGAAAAAARAQLAARACLNCHVLVHGSNHPAGSKFQR